MNIKFLKCHGSGNDFVLIDELASKSALNHSHKKELTLKLTDRRGVIGSDGVLFVVKPTHNNADAKMVVFTPNGIEIPMCVNGIRCVGRYVLDVFPNLKEAKIETQVGIININKDNNYDIISSYSVTPLKPILVDSIKPNIYKNKSTVINDFIPELSSTLKFSIVSLHTPHAVCIVNLIDENQLYKLGQIANTLDNIFPNGLNISFIKQIDNQNIYVRTYERNNIGLSLSCSSAMVASAYIMCLLGILNFETRINIYNKGGLVSCICSKSSATLSGNATFVYDGEITYFFEEHYLSNILKGNIYMNEIETYSNFLSEAKKTCNESSFLIEFGNPNL